MYTMYDWLNDAENAAREEGIAEGRAKAFAVLRAHHIDESLIRDIEAELSKQN